MTRALGTVTAATAAGRLLPGVATSPVRPTVPVQPTRHGGGQRGAIATELAVLTPALVLLLLFVVFAGRLGQAQQDMTQAVAEGARVAALERTGDVSALARRTVAANLAAAGVACTALQVTVSGDPPQPGATVTVDARCDVDMSGVATLGLPRRRAVRSTATEVVDVYRGDG